MTSLAQIALPVDEWISTQVHPDHTHHLRDGYPIYSARFSRVLKFHPPGLAAVKDATGSYHIKPDGMPAYTARFAETFGFYDARAAVVDSSGWHHIDISGVASYPERYSWCGNYQEGRVPVRNSAGRYFHIDRSGEQTYVEQYLYAGDYRDGIACVRRLDGLCIHIDLHGRQIHAFAGLDLDVFHKGFARARDERGWFHLREDGAPAYSARFADVEPFYNGQAYCRDWLGRRVVADQHGQVIHAVWAPSPHTGETAASMNGRFIVVVGNCGSGKTTLAHSMGIHLRKPVLSIDAFRRTASDGSPAGEVRAWQQFLEAIDMSLPTGAVIEFSGSGHMAHLVKLAMENHANYVVLWLRLSPEECLNRVAGRTLDVPYPRFSVPLERLIPELHGRLQREMKNGDIWASDRLRILDGSRSPAEVLKESLEILEGEYS